MLVHVSKLPNLTVEGRRPRITACGSSLTVNVYRKSNPGIFVMQPAEDRAAKNMPCPLYGAR